METQFELTLTSDYKNKLIVAGGFVLVLFALTRGLPLLKLTSANEVMGWVIGVGGVVSILLLARKVGGVPTRIVIAADELRVLNHKSGIETCYAYAAIASYGTSFFNSTEELRLKLRNDSQLKLTIDTRFQDYQIQAFWDMVRTFEAAVARYQARQQPGKLPASLKEKEFVFFASVLATIVLLGLAAGWVLAAWVLISHHQSVGSGFFILSFSLIVYGALWIDSRALRRR